MIAMKRIFTLFLACILLLAAGCDTQAQALIVSADNLHGAVFNMTLGDFETAVNAAYDKFYGGLIIDQGEGWYLGGSDEYFGLPVDTWLCVVKTGSGITLVVNVTSDTGLVEDVMIMINPEDFSEQAFLLRAVTASVACALLPGLSRAAAEKVYDCVTSEAYDYYTGGNTLWEHSHTDDIVMLLCSAVADAYVDTMTSAGMEFGAIE